MKVLKVLVVLLLAAGIFGAAAYFGYELYLKPKQQLIVEQQQIAVEPPPPPPDPSLPDVEKAMKMLTENQREEARHLLAQIVIAYPQSSRIAEVKKTLGDMNVDRLLSTAPTPEKVEYTVVSGDALAKIANRLDSSAELIMRANNMDSTLLQIGMKLVVPKVSFTIQIDSANRTVTLLQEGRFFKEYATLTFNVPGTPPVAPVALNVTEKFAWHEGKRVAFGSKEYMGSTRWIQTSRAGLTIYGVDENPGANPPATGIGLSTADMEELHTLVTRNTPVELR